MRDEMAYCRASSRALSLSPCTRSSSRFSALSCSMAFQEASGSNH